MTSSQSALPSRAAHPAPTSPVAPATTPPASTTQSTPPAAMTKPTRPAVAPSAPRLRTWLVRAAVVLLGMLAGWGAYLANAQGLGGNPLPMPMGCGVAVVMSGSMEPTLSKDDLVVVRRAGTYAPGDVVVWQRGQTLTVHRVVSVEGTRITTRGDANNVDDDPTTLAAVRGKVVLAVPALGAAVLALKTPLGMLVPALGAVALVVLSGRSERAQGAEQLEALRAEVEHLRAAQAQVSEADKNTSASKPASPMPAPAPAAEQPAAPAPPEAGERHA